MDKDAKPAIVLVAKGDPEQTPLLYACGKCGSVHSPNIYLASHDVKHRTALKAAEDCYTCRTHDECDTCGCDTPKGWTRCPACRDAAKLAKAVEVPDDGGPYCEFGGDDYYFDIDEAHDAGIEWVSPCHTIYPKLDAYSILESATEEMFEDASVDDLCGVEEFVAAVEAFNKAQSTPTFFGDYKRKINVAQAMAARSGETTGSPDQELNH